MDPKLSHYPKSYGAWAGDPKGHEPDFTRCCVGVWSKERWSREGQCARKNGFGPDGAYCKQHDPAVKKAREDEARARWTKKWNAERYQWHGRTFFDALVKIADGHNDARGVAQEVIKEFRSGERS